MLVLMRYVGERVLIGSDVAIMVTKVRDNAAWLGIEAPAEKAVHREEIARKIEEQRREAIRSQTPAVSETANEHEDCGEQPAALDRRQRAIEHLRFIELVLADTLDTLAMMPNFDDVEIAGRIFDQVTGRRLLQDSAVWARRLCEQLQARAAAERSAAGVQQPGDAA